MKQKQSLKEINNNYFRKLIGNFISDQDKINDSVKYFEENANLASKDHIVFMAMKNKMGIVNDFYTPPYSEDIYVKGLAGVIGNLHEHLGIPRPLLKDIEEKLNEKIPEALESVGLGVQQKELKMRPLTEVSRNYFKNIIKKYIPTDKIDASVEYFENNASMAAKDHIIFMAMKNKTGIVNDFYTPSYSGEQYIKGLATVISNLQDHLGVPRQISENFEKELATLIAKEINSSKFRT